METGAIIGVDMGGTKVSVGKVAQNHIVAHTTSDIDSRGKEEDILQTIRQAIESLFDEQVVGIGIGVPSVVDVGKGIVYDVQNIPAWKEVPLKEILENHFHKPVYINNDANCFAVGEKYFGKGGPYRNMVGVTLGTGLGTGIIIDDRLYSGPNCGAGEFGHIPYRDRDYEYYCSGQFFIGEHGVSGRTLSERAREGDRQALEIFVEYGSHLAEALKTILLAVDPEAIFLGGSVSRSFLYFRQEMWKGVKTFRYQKSVDRLVIAVTEQPQIAMLGAAALYYDARRHNQTES